MNDKPHHIQIVEAAQLVAALTEKIVLKKVEVEDLSRPYRTADNQLSNLRNDWEKAMKVLNELTLQKRL